MAEEHTYYVQTKGCFVHLLPVPTVGFALMLTHIYLHDWFSQVPPAAIDRLCIILYRHAPLNITFNILNITF